MTTFDFEADIKMTYLKQNNLRYTFEMPKVGAWVKERVLYGTVLNLFAGRTRLFEGSTSITETRVDMDAEMQPDYNMDAFDFLQIAKEFGYSWDTVILDPPYNYRKSMEKYQGKTVSSFRKVKDDLLLLVEKPKRIITFGYHSVSMGESRGYKVKEVLVISHGGAYHDTIATIEDLK